MRKSMVRIGSRETGQQLSRRGLGFEFKIRTQIASRDGVVRKGKFLGGWFQEKIEGIEDRHFGDEIDFDEELRGRLREHQAGQIVACGSCCQFRK